MTWPAWALFKREARATFRGRAPYVVVGLAVGLTCVFAGFNWPDDPILAGRGFNIWFSAYGFLAALGFLLLGGVMLAVPALAIGSVTAERDHDTLAQLRLTLVRPTAAVLVLLAASAGIAVLMLVALAPVFGVILFASGTDAFRLLGALAVLPIAAVTCAALGIACAACARDTTQALGAGYLCALAYAGLPVLLLAFLAELVGYRDSEAMDLIYYTPHGVLCLFTVGLDPFLPRIWPNATRGLPASPAVVLPVLSLLITAVSIAVARWGLFRRDLAERLPRQRARRLRRGQRPSPRPAMLGLGWQAVMQAEVRAAQRWPAAFTTAVVVLLCVLLNGLAIPRSGPQYGPLPWPFSVPILMLIMLVFVLVPRTVAGLIPREWGRGTLPLLRASLLAPHEIVLGKAAAGLLLVWPVLRGILLVEGLTGVLFLSLGRMDALFQLYFGLGTGVAVVLIATAVSTWTGAATRHTGYAIASAYGLLIALQVVLPVCAVFLLTSCFRIYAPHTAPTFAMPFYEACALPSLPGAYLQSTIGLGDARALSDPAALARLMLGLRRPGLAGYTLLWAGSVLINLLLAFAFLAAAIRAFRHRLPNAL